jgi:hypothetical protein
MIGQTRTGPAAAQQMLVMFTAGSSTVVSFYWERQYLTGLDTPVQLLPNHGALGRTGLQL